MALSVIDKDAYPFVLGEYGSVRGDVMGKAEVRIQIRFPPARDGVHNAHPCPHAVLHIPDTTSAAISLHPRMLRALPVSRAVGAPSGRAAVRVVRRVSSFLCCRSCVGYVSDGAERIEVRDRAASSAAQEKEKCRSETSLLYCRGCLHLLCRQRVRLVPSPSVPSNIRRTGPLWRILPPVCGRP